MSLVIEHLWKEFGDEVVLEDLSLTIVPRAFVALVGPNGSGKTTLLRLLEGREQPTRGWLSLDGMEMPDVPMAEGGVVAHDPALDPQSTVLGNLVRGAEPRAETASGGRAEEDRARVDEARALLAEVGLAGMEARYPEELSARLRERLGLAQTMMLKPGVLLLDEPFAALPVEERTELDALVMKLWNAWPMTIVLATQDLGEAFALATRVIALERRRDGEALRGAAITRDIDIWPPRVAGQDTYYDADIAPEADEIVGFGHMGRTDRPQGAFARGSSHAPAA